AGEAGSVGPVDEELLLLLELLPQAASAATAALVATTLIPLHKTGMRNPSTSLSDRSGCRGPTRAPGGGTSGAGSPPPAAIYRSRCAGEVPQAWLDTDRGLCRRGADRDARRRCAAQA